MYDGDAPLAERRAGALTLDRDLLRELLGQEELRELLDPDALADLELEPPGADRRPAGDDASTASTTCCAGSATCRPTRSRRGREGGAAAGDAWLTELVATRRAVRARIAGDGPLDRDRGRRPLPRRRRRRRRRPACPTAFLGAGRGRARRAARPVRPDPRPVPDARAGAPLGPAASASSSDALERLLAAGTLLRGEFRPGGAEREWCDPDVLRLLRRRSLARLRREVEPVDPAALRPVPARRGTASRRSATAPAAAPRHGRPGAPRRGRRPARRASPIPASVLERDVLPARSPATSRGCSTSSARWARSRGSGGGASAATTGGSSSSGRAARSCGRPGRPTASEPPGRAAPRRDPRAPRRAAAPRSTASCSRPRAAARTARSSTRCGTSSGPARSPTTRSRRCGRCAGSGPAAAAVATARPGRLTALGPPEAAGRWSLVDAERDRAPPTERLHAQALALLERHGVADPRGGRRPRASRAGSPAVYPVLRALEEAGRIRRGYFVDGLGAAQFALAGALDRLRAAPRGRARSGRAARSTCWPRPTRRTRTAPRSPGRVAARTTGGRSSAPPARTSCWSTASPPSTSSAAARRSRRCPPPTIRRSRSRRPRALGGARRRRPDPRARHPKVDGEADRRRRRSASASLAAGFVPGYRGLVLRAAR